MTDAILTQRRRAAAAIAEETARFIAVRDSVLRFYYMDAKRATPPISFIEREFKRRLKGLQAKLLEAMLTRRNGTKLVVDKVADAEFCAGLIEAALAGQFDRPEDKAAA